MAEHAPGDFCHAPHKLTQSFAACFSLSTITFFLPQARRDAKEQARRDRLAAEEAERVLVSKSQYVLAIWMLVVMCTRKSLSRHKQ